MLFGVPIRYQICRCLENNESFIFSSIMQKVIPYNILQSRVLKFELIDVNLNDHKIEV